METGLSNNNPKLKPPLKWAGGKRWIVPYLKPFWERCSHRRLVEPLCGGLSVTFGLLPQRALLNDINIHLINFFQWLKKGLIISIPMKNDDQLYYSYREEFNSLIKRGQAHSRKAAELFYYLNRTGYNGLCRFNSKDEFNVPFGRYKQINYRRDFSDYKEIFSNWELISKDFEEVPLKADDFVYSDPPYDVEFTQYAKRGFSWDDQVRLAERLAKHRGPVIISNQATERVIDLYRKMGFTVTFLKGPRMISCTGEREPALEVLAVKNMVIPAWYGVEKAK